MRELDILKNQWNNNEISATALYHAMKPHQQILLNMYPNVDNAMSRVYLWLNDLPESASYCNKSGLNRRLKSVANGFMQFCGNQGTCMCNRENSEKHLLNRTNEEQREINKKRAETNIEKYGNEFASKLPEIKEKAAATCLVKYGTKSPTENLEIFEKVKKTLLENYGVEYPHQDPNLAQRAVDTWLKTRGVSRPAKDITVRQAMQTTMMEKYGVSHNMKIPEIRLAVKKKNRTHMYASVLSARPAARPLFTVDQFIDGNSKTEWKWECKSCGEHFFQALIPGKDVRCITCNPLNESWGERMIRQWLDSQNISYLKKDRKMISPLELDFYLPQFKLAIEFNGIYWHSERILDDKNYHFNKFKACYEKDIRLIQIWEQDLTNKPLIVFSRLAHAVGLNDSKIGARKCNLAEISTDIARNFFNEYHLQGFHASGRYYGLLYNNELVAAISIGKSRYTKNADYELTRFAMKSGYTVQGGLSKLLTHVKELLGSIKLVSYADLSWSYGNSYKKQGFQFSHFSAPNYFYFKDLTDIRSRVAFQKHKIADKDDTRSESQIAESLGYNRFFDAGNSVWIKQL